MVWFGWLLSFDSSSPHSSPPEVSFALLGPVGVGDVLGLGRRAPRGCSSRAAPTSSDGAGSHQVTPARARAAASISGGKRKRMEKTLGDAIWCSSVQWPMAMSGEIHLLQPHSPPAPGQGRRRRATAPPPPRGPALRPRPRRAPAPFRAASSAAAASSRRTTRRSFSRPHASSRPMRTRVPVNITVNDATIQQ